MRKGGRYIVKKKGDEPVRLEGTEDHPKGNQPRPVESEKPQQATAVQKEVEKDGAEK